MVAPVDLRIGDALGRLRRAGLVLLTWVLLTACGVPDRQAIQSGGDAVERSRNGDFAAQERLPPRGEAWVIFGGDTVRAEVARTPAERERGLMYREELEAGRGMLFVFPDAQIRSFWMRDTFIPLDIAYLNETLRVVDIQSMEPQTEALHESAGPAMFALEVPGGWFATRGIEVGETARVVFGPG